MPQIPPSPKSLQDLIEQVGLYPADAYAFIDRALGYTVEKTHGEKAVAVRGSDPSATVATHISGQQFCRGLREYALEQWGMLAGTVLKRWNITRTEDVGRIVFALVDNGFMSKTEQDSPTDFANVFEFQAAFESGYRIVVPESAVDGIEIGADA